MTWLIAITNQMMIIGLGIEISREGKGHMKLNACKIAVPAKKEKPKAFPECEDVIAATMASKPTNPKTVPQ